MTLPPELEHKINVLESAIQSGRDRAWKHGYWWGLGTGIVVSYIAHLLPSTRWF